MASDPSHDVGEAWRSLGIRLAEYRKGSGYTQETLAAHPRFHYGRSTIANVETGRQRVSRSFWSRCDELLKTGGALTTAYDQLSGTAGRTLLVSVGQAPAPPLFITATEASTGITGRRSVLLASIWTIAASSGLIDGVGDGARIGMADVTRLRAITAMYRSMDYECGGGALQSDVARFAEAATDLLDAPQGDVVRKPLLGAVAEARQLAGWTAFDAGRHSDAQRHWQSAERAAVAAEDARLAARIRYCQARQYQHLRHNRDAVQTLRLARDQLGIFATPALAAMLDGAEAASLAALGRFSAAEFCLKSATLAFEKVDFAKEPEWMSFFTHGEILAQYGRVFRDRARDDRRYGRQAVFWAEKAVDAFGDRQVRSSLLNQVGLCSALFLAGEPERAVLVGAEVLARSGGLTSTRIRDRVYNLKRDLVVHAGHPTVQDFSTSISGLGTRAQ